MRCPRCKRAIDFEATSHEACGWNVRPEAARIDVVACSFDGCTTPARYNVQRPQGRANVCHAHYLRLAQMDAQASRSARKGGQPEAGAGGPLRSRLVGQFPRDLPIDDMPDE